MIRITMLYSGNTIDNAVLIWLPMWDTSLFNQVVPYYLYAWFGFVHSGQKVTFYWLIWRRLC